MSADRLLNLMRGAAMGQSATRAESRKGLISAYDPSNYAVKVQLMPEGAETGWLPLASPWVGNGWGIVAGPSIGDMVDVHFQEGSPDAGSASLRYYNDEDRPPGACPSGEFWLAHSSGSLLKFHNDGSVEMHAALAINSSAPLWTHTGPVVVHGLITGDGGLVMAGGSGAAVQVNGSLTTTGDVTAGSISLDNHGHTNVQPGSGVSGPPEG